MNFKYATLQLRARRRNPWPKMYVCSKEHQEKLMEGLPCCLIVQAHDMPSNWHQLIEEQPLEAFGYRAVKRKDCQDTSAPEKPSTKVIAELERQLDCQWEEMSILVPVFQKHLNWKNSDLPQDLIATPDTTTPLFLFHRSAVHTNQVHGRSGPPMKLPSGDVLETCCTACKFNFENLQGNCRFGDDTCMEQMDFPGKSRMVQNLKRYSQHRASASIRDTQELEVPGEVEEAKDVV